jgi:hypothetical protein
MAFPDIDMNMLGILVMLTIILVGFTFALLGMQIFKMHNELKELRDQIGGGKVEEEEIEPKSTILDEPEPLAPPLDLQESETPEVTPPPPE